MKVLKKDICPNKLLCAQKKFNKTNLSIFNYYLTHLVMYTMDDSQNNQPRHHIP